jgi:hypothetical protein
MHKTVEKSERTRKSGQHWTQDTKRKRKEIKIKLHKLTSDRCIEYLFDDKILDIKFSAHDAFLE